MSLDREKLTDLKESFWKEPEPIKEEKAKESEDKAVEKLDESAKK